MRLIDADAMIKDLEKKVDENCTDFHKETVGLDLVISKMVKATMIKGDIQTAKEWINAQPTIDAVEVVRCKECRHRYSGVRSRFCIGRHEDFFCAYGVKRS